MRIKTVGFEQATLEKGSELYRAYGGPLIVTKIAPQDVSSTLLTALQDDFDDGYIEPTKWAVNGQISAVQEHFGAIRIVPPNGTAGFSGVNSIEAYSLAAAAAAVKVPAVTSSNSSMSTRMRLVIDASNELSIGKTGTNLRMTYEVAGVTTAQILAFNTVSHLFWRIREAGGTIYWETSADGVNWIARHSLANPFNPGQTAAMSVYLEAGSSGISSNQGEARFDNFNVLTPGYMPTRVRSGDYSLMLSTGCSILVSATSKGGGGYFRTYVTLRSYPASTNTFMSFYRESDYSPLFELNINPDGSLQAAYRGDAADPDAPGETLGIPSSPLVLEHEYFVEFAIIGNADSTGKHLESRINGQVFMQADVDDLLGYDGFLRIGMNSNIAASYDCYIDDIAINDASGTSSNTWCGPGKAVLLRVSGADESEPIGWDPGGVDSGTQWGQVTDVSPPDGENSYLIGSAINDQIEFRLRNPYRAGIRAGDSIKVVSPSIRWRLAANTDSAALRLFMRAGTGLIQEGKELRLNGYFTGNDADFKELSLTDDFADRIIDPDLWTTSGIVVEQGGTMQLRLIGSKGYGVAEYADTTLGVGRRPALLTSKEIYDISSGAALFELADAGDQSIDSKEVIFEVYHTDEDNRVYILLQSTADGGDLVAYQEVAGVTTELSSAPYDENDMRWLRIREKNGTTYLEYNSQEFGAWTVLASAANPIDVTEVYVRVRAETTEQEVESTNVHIDNFRILGGTSKNVWYSGDQSGRARDAFALSMLPQSALEWSIEDLAAARLGVTVTDSDPDIWVTSLWAYVEYQPFGEQNIYSIKVNGIDRKAEVKKGTLSIDDKLDEQVNTCNMTLYDLDGNGRPLTDQPVEIVVNSRAVFSGWIVNPESDRVGGEFSEYPISCVDHTRLLDRRLVSATYLDIWDDDLIRLLVDEYAPDDGIGTYHVARGVKIAQISFNYIPMSQAIKQIAALTQRSWYIDYLRDIHYFPLTQSQAPFDVLEQGQEYKRLNISEDSTQVRNRVFVRGGTELTTEPTVEAVKADGVQRQFLLAEKPHDITVTLNGDPQTIGIKNIDSPADFDFMLNYQEKYIECGSSTTTPAAGDELEVSYNYDVPILISVEDGVSIAANAAKTGGSGVFEHVIIDNQIASTQQARDRATAELTSYSRDLVEASYITEETGLRSGQYQHFNVPSQDRDDDYIVQSVTARSIGGGNFVYTARLASARSVGIIRFLIDLLQLNRTVGTIDPNEKVDQLFSLTDQLDSITDSLTIDSGPTTFKWSNDAGTTPDKLQWNLGQWK